MLYEVNLIALDKALTLLFGDQHSELVRKLYEAFDQAMKQGYELGKLDGQENLEAACDAAFDNGWEHGEAEGRGVTEVDAMQSIDESFDDGYLEGVDDARRRPAFADSHVQDILNDRADEAFEALGDADFDDGGPYNESYDPFRGAY